MGTDEAQSNCFPPKKPTERVGFNPRQISVRSRINTLLKQVHELDQQRDLVHDRIRKLTRVLRQDDGRTPWIPIMFAFGVCGILAMSLYHSWPRAHFYTYPDDYLRTIQNVDTCEPDGTCGYRRVMQEVANGVPQPETEMVFCEKPRFEAGHTLKWVRLVQRGSCTAIDGFDVVRGSNHLPTLPDGCVPDYSLAPMAGHIACEGGRAKF